MKILQIGPFPENINLIKGGVEASVYGLSNELAKSNEVFVIDIPNNNFTIDLTQQINNVYVSRFYKKGKSNYYSIKRLFSIIKTIKIINPEICHLHGSGYFMLLITLYLKLLRFKCILTIHGLVHVEKKKVLIKRKSIINWVKYVTFSWSEFMLINFFNEIIVDTEYVRNEIIQYKSSGKIIRLPELNVIPQGINSDYFKISNQSIENLILSVGAFTHRKGHHLLLDSIFELLKTNDHFNVIIAGVKSDLEYFKSIENNIIKLNLQKKVQLQANLTFSEVLQLYSKARVFVLHSEEESQGIVFCEAMAAGLPIVSTNVGGIPNVVHDGVNGFLCDFGETNIFAKKMDLLLNNTDLLSKISNNNKIHSMNYNWETISNNILSLYERKIIKC